MLIFYSFFNNFGGVQGTEVVYLLSNDISSILLKNETNMFATIIVLDGFDVSNLLLLLNLKLSLMFKFKA